MKAMKDTTHQGDFKTKLRDFKSQRIRKKMRQTTVQKKFVQKLPRIRSNRKRKIMEKILPKITKKKRNLRTKQMKMLRDFQKWDLKSFNFPRKLHDLFTEFEEKLEGFGEFAFEEPVFFQRSSFFILLYPFHPNDIGAIFKMNHVSALNVFVSKNNTSFCIINVKLNENFTKQIGSKKNPVLVKSSMFFFIIAFENEFMEKLKRDFIYEKISSNNPSKTKMDDFIKMTNEVCLNIKRRGSFDRNHSIFDPKQKTENKDFEKIKPKEENVILRPSRLRTRNRHPSVNRNPAVKVRIRNRKTSKSQYEKNYKKINCKKVSKVRIRIRKRTKPIKVSNGVENNGNRLPSDRSFNGLQKIKKMNENNKNNIRQKKINKMANHKIHKDDSENVNEEVRKFKKAIYPTSMNKRNRQKQQITFNQFSSKTYNQNQTNSNCNQLKTIENDHQNNNEQIWDFFGKIHQPSIVQINSDEKQNGTQELTINVQEQEDFNRKKFQDSFLRYLKKPSLINITKNNINSFSLNKINVLSEGVLIPTWFDTKKSNHNRNSNIRKETLNGMIEHKTNKNCERNHAKTNNSTILACQPKALKKFIKKRFPKMNQKLLQKKKRKEPFYLNVVTNSDLVANCNIQTNYPDIYDSNSMPWLIPITKTHQVDNSTNEICTKNSKKTTMIFSEVELQLYCNIQVPMKLSLYDTIKNTQVTKKQRNYWISGASEADTNSIIGDLILNLKANEIIPPGLDEDETNWRLKSISIQSNIFFVSPIKESFSFQRVWQKVLEWNSNGVLDKNYEEIFGKKIVIVFSWLPIETLYMFSEEDKDMMMDHFNQINVAEIKLYGGREMKAKLMSCQMENMDIMKRNN